MSVWLPILRPLRDIVRWCRLWSLQNSRYTDEETSLLLIDPENHSLLADVTLLPRTAGICIFIDVVGSTQMKQRSMPEWVALLSNVFSWSKSFLQDFKPLKGIGDELMYFIGDVELEAKGATHLTIVDALVQIARLGDTSVPETKIVAAYCTDVYPMTFLEGSRDVYGADIDRTARLKGITPALEARHLVLDDALFTRTRDLVAANGGAVSFEWFELLHGPYALEAKGLSKPVLYHRAAV
jgi:class 3 adenylate cyclase